MKAIEYLLTLKPLSLEEANSQLQNLCGIVNFLSGLDEIDELNTELFEQTSKDEYGDWQTNYSLALDVCRSIKAKGIDPEVIIEPTCGKGAFLLAAAEVFDCKKMFGIEIYKPYLNALRLQVLENALSNKKPLPQLELFHRSIFDFNFEEIKKFCKEKRLLILGNPPWVTNSKLGSINSKNLPFKSNFKKQKGIEAITGKANFDIAEYICNTIIKEFGSINTNLAFLIKNSVIKNLVHSQLSVCEPICQIEQYNIDALKEFGVSVSASLLFMKFGEPIAFECNVFDFCTNRKQARYGWTNNKFVSNIETYRKWQKFDKKSPFEWWSGVKHDCAKVMELTKIACGKYLNGFGEEVDIEEDIVYPLLKSSDIQKASLSKIRKYVILTQHSPSDPTDYIAAKCPKAYKYLLQHANLLDKRGSVIYKKRPRFAIFGIGDYSFEKYKVAVSALYKTPKFALIKPINGRPVMLDDTCYFVGFDTRKEAEMVLELLNHQITQEFLRTLMFSDAKRVIKKELLMRIDLAEIAKTLYPTISPATLYKQSQMSEQLRQLALF